MELVTLWFAGWHSVHWATPARTKSCNLATKPVGNISGYYTSSLEYFPCVVQNNLTLRLTIFHFISIFHFVHQPVVETAKSYIYWMSYNFWKPLQTIKPLCFYPGWCGSVGWVSSCRLKCRRFNSPSGHIPGLQVQLMFLSHISVSLLFLPPFPSPQTSIKGKHNFLKTLCFWQTHEAVCFQLLLFSRFLWCQLKTHILKCWKWSKGSQNRNHLTVCEYQFPNCLFRTFFKIYRH